MYRVVANRWSQLSEKCGYSGIRLSTGNPWQLLNIYSAFYLHNIINRCTSKFYRTFDIRSQGPFNGTPPFILGFYAMRDSNIYPNPLSDANNPGL